MLLVIIISIIATGAVIVWALYSAILPFFWVLGSTANYNIAYYGAIGSTERSLLSLRYHVAGYEWRGGFSWSNATSGVLADLIPANFGVITRNWWNMERSITSLTNGVIPQWSGGDVERLLEGTGSREFNMLTYDNIIELPLYKDNALSSSERYVTGAVAKVSASNGMYIRGTLRLPPKILGAFGGGGTYKLDTSTDIDNDNITDDMVVNWTFKWYNASQGQWFSIIPTIKVDYNQQSPIYDFENTIRESHINDSSNSNGTNTRNIYLGEPGGDYEYNLIRQPTIVTSLMTGHNAIPVNSSVIDPLDGFSSILNDSTFSNTSLSFNLTNKLASTINQIFPFLEYQIKICEVGVGCSVPVSNRYFTIDASSKVGEYDVHIRLNKPVIQKDNTSAFAIIF